MPIPRVKKSEILEQMQRLVIVYGYPKTPGSEGTISEELVNVWYRVFKDKSYNQVKNAVDAHIATDDSLRTEFPLPGRVNKLVKPEDIYTEEEKEAAIRADEERKKWEKEERWNSLTKEEQEAELKRKEEWNKKFREMMKERGIQIE